MSTPEAHQKLKNLFIQFAKEQYLNVDETTTPTTVINDIQLTQNELTNLEEHLNQQDTASLSELLEIYNDKFIDIECHYSDNLLALFKSEYQAEIDKLDMDPLDIIDVLTNGELLEFRTNIDEDNVDQNIKIEEVIILEPFTHRDMEYSCNNFNDLISSVDLSDTESTYNLKLELEQSSLKPLLEKQGFSIDEFIMYLISCELDEDHPLDDNESFMSIYQEVINASDYSALMVLRETPFGDFIKDVDSNKTDITIKKDDIIGFYNMIHGSGSVFEIKLNQPMTFTKDEYMRTTHKGMPGYTIEECYGSFLH